MSTSQCASTPAPLPPLPLPPCNSWNFLNSKANYTVSSVDDHLSQPSLLHWLLSRCAVVWAAKHDCHWGDRVPLLRRQEDNYTDRKDKTSFQLIELAPSSPFIVLHSSLLDLIVFLFYLVAVLVLVIAVVSCLYYTVTRYVEKWYWCHTLSCEEGCDIFTVKSVGKKRCTLRNCKSSMQAWVSEWVSECSSVRGHWSII